MKRLNELSAFSGTAKRSTIKEWAHFIRQRKADLIAASAADSGRDETENLFVEWAGVESTLRFLESEVEAFFAPTPVKSYQPRLFGVRSIVKRRIPLGRVLVVGTWNYPLSLHLSQILFALAAGNEVVYKGSPYSPKLSAVFEDLIPKFAASRFKVIQVAPKTLITKVSAGEFQGVVYTGGTAGAQAFAKACASRMIPFVLEASGSEVALFLNDTPRFEQNLKHLFWAIFHFSGQTCVAPRFWLLPKAKLESTWSEVEKFMRTEDALVVDRPSLRHEGVVKEHEEWCAWARDLKPDGECAHEKRSEFVFFRFDDLSKVPSLSPPNFGPAVIVAGYDDLRSAVDWVINSPWSLLSTLLGTPSKKDWDDISRLDASIVSFDESIVAAADAAIPFGGRRSSGTGVCHGIEGLMALSRPQTWQEQKSWPFFDRLGFYPQWKTLSVIKKLKKFIK